MATSAARRLRRLSAKLGFDREWYLVFVAAGIGLVMGAAAIAFILPLQWIEHWAEDADPTLLWWLVPTAPIVGALLTGVVVYLIGGPGTGAGVSAVMYAVYRKRSTMPLRIAARKWIASTFTIGSGGSAGAEGPIVTIGSVIGSNIGRLLGTNPQNTATLLGCGAAAGIASVFNAPIAGIFFVMEILLRDFSLKTFTPIVIASVISAAFTQALLGDEPIFARDAAFRVDAFNMAEIPNYLLLGLICGAAAVLFIRALDFSETAFGRLRVPTILRPAVGAAMLGLLGLLYLFLVRPEQALPPFFGNGYPVIEGLISPGTYFEGGTTSGDLLPVGMMILPLAALAIFKGLATCLTIGSGGAGGLFAPSLLMGAAVGGLFGYIVNALGWFPAATPAHYALVGMAAMVAGTIHAPLTAILMVYEITQSYHIILPLMFAAVISTVFGRLLFPDSVYTIKLSRMGVRVGSMSDLTILRRLSVREVPLRSVVSVRPNDSAQRLLELAEQTSASDFVVTDGRDHYVGLVTAEDLRSALVYREAIPLLQVNEIMRSDLPTVTRDETLDVVLDRFSRHQADALAVTDDGGERVVGLITRSRLLAKYQSVLSRS